MARLRRYLVPHVLEDLRRGPVFVTGARQIGKTTMALGLPGAPSGHLDCDLAEDRDRVLRGEMPNSNLWVLDEVHRCRGWPHHLTGILRGRKPGQQVLVACSAPLDLDRDGGGILADLPHRLRLHPLSVAELGLAAPREFRDLLALGGFPEPFLSGSEARARRWSREYRELLVREELAIQRGRPRLPEADGRRRVRRKAAGGGGRGVRTGAAGAGAPQGREALDLGRQELLMLSLPERVGSMLSVNALRKELGVAHGTVAQWLSRLERAQVIFRIPRLLAPSLPAVLKTVKHYHLDWTLPRAPEARFEDLVACHLWKWVHFQQDVEGRDLALRFFRGAGRHDVDFVITEGRTPVLLVTCRWSDTWPDKGLAYLKARCPSADAWQVSAVGTTDRLTPEGIRLAPAVVFLGALV